jgi:CheY-like chemotaxis protein
VRPNKSILIIDDDAGIRDMLAIALEMEGYSIFTACNGQEGIEKLTNIPTPSLILLDLMMPVMNGYEFLDSLHTNPKTDHIPVVLLTAYADQAKKMTAHSIIRKPIALATLLKAVETHCH